MNKPPLVLIAGPTASGKSALAMALAELTPSIIINADSMQVYRDLRVITSRPSEDDEARVPHRLFGYRDAADACSAAHWAADATGAIAQAVADQRLPILVGGTGLYIRTLLDGIAPVPIIDAAVRGAVRNLPPDEAYTALEREDAPAAARLAPNDSARVMRALEVIRSTGRTLADWQSERTGGIGGAVRLAPLVLLPPREWLVAQCDARFDVLFPEAQDEVARLMARNLDPALPVMRAIGVAAIMAHLGASLSETEAKAAGTLATRQYAKRQYTWFRRQSPADWPQFCETLNYETNSRLAIMLRETTLTR